MASCENSVFHLPFSLFTFMPISMETPPAPSAVCVGVVPPTPTAIEQTRQCAKPCDYTRGRRHHSENGKRSDEGGVTP